MKPNIRKRALVLVLIFAIFFTYIQIPNNIVYGSVSYNGQTMQGDYTIGTTTQLSLLSEKVNNGTTYEGSTFTLTNNIVYDSSILNNYIPIGNQTNKFKGNFNGNGFYVSGINIYYPNNDQKIKEESFKGIFGYIENSTIKNLGIVNSTIEAHNYIGGICGFAFRSTIENCYNASKIKCGERLNNSQLHSYYTAGGILGYGQYVSVKDSINKGIVEGQWVGGIVGKLYGESPYSNYGVFNCTNEGSVAARFSASGIIAYGYSMEIWNCISKGTVSSNYGNNGNINTTAGIIYELSRGNIYDCKNYSTIKGGSGIANYIEGANIYRCENYGSISGAAGIVGYNDASTVAYCANFANVNGMAGICGGSSRGRFYYCYNIGNIISNGSIEEYEDGGTYISYAYPTGIVGYSNNTQTSIVLIGCYSIGSLSGNMIKKYGLVGYGGLGTRKISIDNSYYLDSIGAESACIIETDKSRERTATYMKSQGFVDLINTNSINYGGVENPYVKSTKNNGHPVLWYQMTVEDIKIEGAATINKGDTGVYKAVITPDNAPNKKILWTVSNTDLAEVTPVGNGEALIVKGIKKGTVTLTAKAQDGSGVTATKSITIGSSFVSSEASYILIDEAVSFKTAWKDAENDPLYKSEYRYVQTPCKLKDGVSIDNSLGYVAYHNTWQTTAYKQFSKVGTYTIQYRVQDNPPTANKTGFENYRYYSDYVENTIYVHRKPIAQYSISEDGKTVADSSYDLDHSVSLSNKGIVKWKWTYANTNGIVQEYVATTKNDGVNKVNTFLNTYLNVEYKLILMVQDMEGAWSEPTIKSAGQYSKPIADFAIEKNPLTYPEGQIITDLSYDTNGLTLSYQWNVYKNSVNILSSTNSNITSTLNSKISSMFPNVTGTYTVSLKVVNSAGVESNIVTKTFDVVVYNQAPTADFDLVSNESPAWTFPKELGIHTLKLRPTDGLFFEEKAKFNVSASDPNSDNLGFSYNWKLERFAVKEVNGISGAATNTYSYSTQYPFTNSFKGQGLPWGAYKITLTVTDKPPIPPYTSTDAKSAVVTKYYYIVPELNLTGSFESSKTEIMVGDSIKIKATTNKMTDSVKCSLDGTIFTLSKISEDSNNAYWEKDITIPDTITESGTYQLQFVGNTTYGGNGTVTREIRDTVSLDIIALKLINFRITDVVNHPHLSFPKTKDMLQAELIKYKAGYYVTFRIDSKGKPDTVTGRIDIGNNGSVDQIINLSKVASGDTETWQGRFYTSAYLPTGTVISIKLDCNKGATIYDYNIKENWDGRSLIVNGSALMDGRINLTN